MATTHSRFETYTWAHPVPNNANIPASALLRFAEKVRDISVGSEIILQIAERHDLDTDPCDDTDPPPYFNNYHIGVLLRMVQASMGMLSSDADSLNDWVYQQCTPEGRAGDYASAAHCILSRGEKLPNLDE